jgi:hypothetical protein
MLRSLLEKLKRDSFGNTFCHSVSQGRHSRAHCSLWCWWFLDNGSRRYGMRTIIPTLKRRRLIIEANSSTPVAVLEHRQNTLDEAIRSVMTMRTKWWSYRALITFLDTVSALLCVRTSSFYWSHTSITVNAACPVRNEIFVMTNLLPKD